MGPVGFGKLGPWADEECGEHQNISFQMSDTQTDWGVVAVGGWGLPMGYVIALLCTTHIDAYVDDRSMTAPQQTLLFSVFSL